MRKSVSALENHVLEQMENQHPRLIKINGRVWHTAAQLSRRKLYCELLGELTIVRGEARQ